MSPLIILAAVKKIGGMFFTKKRVVTWLSAVLLGVGAVAAGMSNPDFKEAVCSATPISAE